MKNLTNPHKKLDRLIEKMGTVDETLSLARQIAETNRQLARSVGLVMKIVVEGREEARGLMKIAVEGREEARGVAQIQEDVALLTHEALKASRESAERTAQILAEIRKH